MIHSMRVLFDNSRYACREIQLLFWVFFSHWWLFDWCCMASLCAPVIIQIQVFWKYALHCNKRVVFIVIFLLRILPFGILIYAPMEFAWIFNLFGFRFKESVHWWIHWLASSRMNWFWRFITSSCISSIQNTKFMNQYFSFDPYGFSIFVFSGKSSFPIDCTNFIHLLRLCSMVKSIVTVCQSIINKSYRIYWIRIIDSYYPMKC